MMLCNFRSNRFFNPRSARQRAAVAVSACLAGERVRYDGKDKRLPVYPLLNEELKLVPICPEIGAGLGVPRPPVQLVKVGSKTLALGRDDIELDVTAALENHAAQSLQRLSNNYSLCGYLWKSRSPSCGLDSTPLFDANGSQIALTAGIQAEYIRRHLPYIKHGEETSLADESAVKAFILQCRLVFDFLYGAAVSLHALHDHYVFIRAHLDEETLGQLETLSAGDNKPEYLVALLEGCNQIPNDDLLKLFDV